MNNRDAKNQFLVRIYKNNKDTMYSLAFKILKDEQEAENIVQESIISVDKKYDKLRKMDNNSLSRYVHKTVKNKSLNSLKRSNKIVTVDFHQREVIIENTDYDISFELLENEFFDEIVRHLLNAKSEKHAEAFMYRYYNDFSYEQIGDLMNVTDKHARVLVCRAMKKVEEFIDKRREYEQKNIK